MVFTTSHKYTFLTSKKEQELHNWHSSTIVLSLFLVNETDTNSGRLITSFFTTSNWFSGEICCCCCWFCSPAGGEFWGVASETWYLFDSVAMSSVISTFCWMFSAIFEMSIELVFSLLRSSARWCSIGLLLVESWETFDDVAWSLSLGNWTVLIVIQWCLYFFWLRFYGEKWVSQQIIVNSRSAAANISVTTTLAVIASICPKING